MAFAVLAKSRNIYKTTKDGQVWFSPVDIEDIKLFENTKFRYFL